MPLEIYQGSYYFDSSVPPGQNIPVYVLDSGAALGHSEFDWIRANTRWITVGMDVNPNGNGQQIAPAEDDSQTDPNEIFKTAKAHGTAMLALVSGQKAGVSKFVKPIIIRVPRRTLVSAERGKAGGATFEDYIEGLSKVCDDLAGQGITASSTTTSILLLSLLFPRSEFMRDGIDVSVGFSGRMQVLLAKAILQGVLPITGTGNSGSNTIDGWPANFGGTAPRRPAALPQLLVVGAVVSATSGNNNGLAWDKSSFDVSQGLPHVFAPGFDLKTADGNNADINHYKSSQGTSDSAAITAGLAAYFLALANSGALILTDKSPAGLKAYILQTSYPRKPGTLAIWNGVIPVDGTCQWTPPGTAVKKRDLLGVGRMRGRQDSESESESDPGWDIPTSYPLAGTCGLPASLSSIMSSKSLTQLGGPHSTVVSTSSVITSSTSTSANQPSSTTSTSISATQTSSTTSISTSASQPSSITSTSISEVASSTQPSTFITVTCNSATPVPGECGNEACAYVIASEVQNALCTTDYCYCGGKFGPILTTSISGSVSSGCHYTTVPTCMNCASAACTSTTATVIATVIATPTPTVSPLTLGTQQCNDAAHFSGHRDIASASVDEYVWEVCLGTVYKNITSSSNPFKPVNTYTTGVYYYMAITWVEGCITTVTSQNPWEPIPGNSTVTCRTLFENDYSKCDNTGVGGSIVVGCLKYEFTPSNNGAIT